MKKYDEQYEETKNMDEDEAAAFIEASENEHFL